MENTATLTERLSKTSPSNAVDYTKGHMVMEFIHEGTKVYASINEIFYNEFCGGEEGLAPTGSYFVYLLHPTRGSLHFTLEFDEEKRRWDIPDPSSEKIPDEILNDGYKPIYNDNVTKILVGEAVIKAISDKIESYKM